MDGHKEEDASVSRGDLGESTERVSEHVARESEAPLESSGFEAQGQVGRIEGSNQAGGGEDIMMEVVGSHVFVAGVCDKNSGVKVVGEEHINDAEICGGGCGSVEAGAEIDLRSLDGRDDVIDDSGKEIGVSSGEVSSCSGLKTGVEGPLVEDKVVEESVERNKEVIGDESGGGLIDETSSHENGVQNDEVQNGGTGTRIELSTTFVGSTGGETQVVHVEKVVVITEGKGLERGLAKDDVESGSEMVSGSEAQDHGAENVVETSMVASRTPSGEIQVVDKEAVKESENAGEKALVRGAEEGREINAGWEGAHQDVETQNLRILGDETQNPGSQTVVAGSSVMLEYSTVQTQVVEEAADLVGEECLNPKVNALGAHQDVETQNLRILGEETQNPGSQTVVAGSSVMLEYSTVQTQVVEEAADLVSEECLNPKVDAPGAHQDVETQNLRILGDETQNPGSQTVVAGSSVVLEYSTVQTQVVEEAAELVSEECLNPKVDASGSHAVEGITSSLGEKQVSIAETDDGGPGKSLDEQNQIAFSREVAQMNKEEFMCSTMEDSQSFCQPTQVVGNEDATMDKKVHPDSENHQQFKLEGCLGKGTAHDVAQVLSSTQPPMEIGGQVSNAELDEKLSCSGNVQNFKDEKLSMETELDTEVTSRGEEIPLIHNQEILNSNVEVQTPAENDQPLVASHMEKGIVVEQELNGIEQVNSYVGQEIEVQKQPKMVDTIGGSTENYRTACSDPISTGQSTHEVVGSEVMAVDDKASSNPIVEVPNSQMHIHIIKEGEIAPKESEEVLDSEVGGLWTAEGDRSTAGDLSEVNSSIGQEMQVEEQVIASEQASLHEGPEMEVEGSDSDTEQPEVHEEKFVRRTSTRAGSLVKSHQASYQFSLEDEGEFYVSDIVWGKVRSHPWWPGQIYDPSDASEKAMKYHKKDCFLVAYFGDRTFAWVDASQLKPFYSHFSQVEKQSNSEVFQNAVSCALQEVSRRLELGLACPCMPKDAYDKIRLQIVENTGIRQKSSVREAVDKSARAHSFQPDKLVEYMKALADSPSGGADRLDLVIAKAQLLSFYRLKGYSQLPEFQFCGALEENSVDASHFADTMHATPVSKDDEHIYAGQATSETQRISYHKRKHNLKDSMYPRKKERSLSELMSGSFDSLDNDEFESDGKAGGKLASPSSGKKRRAVDFAADDLPQDGRKTISLAKVSISTPNIPKPSFKIGECIRRVASQMTGSPSILKGNSERLQKLDGDGSDISLENSEDAEGKRMILPTDYSLLDDLLSQLHLAARDPMKGYSFLNIIISFFSDFRNSIIADRSSADKSGGKRRKSSQAIMGSQETFEFEDMSDTYWTDRVIQNGAEEQPSAPPPATNKRGYQLVPVELKPVQKSRRSYSRKQYSDGNHDLTPPKPLGYVDENSPAELIMNFSEVDTVPSETNLNKMFKCFGPLKESETEVDREASRARVVFKKCSDAEVAHSSAAKFNIFGPAVVNYQLSYSISDPFKASPIFTSLGEEYAT